MSSANRSPASDLRPDIRAQFRAIQPYLNRSRARAYWALVSNRGMVIASLWLADWIAHPLAYLLCLIVIANRQLGLAILMHDCSHYALFPTRQENDFWGQWGCAAAVFADLERYRRYHLEHHLTAGTDADPDRSNYRPYPVSAASFRRKVMRDILGITGIKTLILL